VHLQGNVLFHGLSNVPFVQFESNVVVGLFSPRLIHLHAYIIRYQQKIDTLITADMVMVIKYLQLVPGLNFPMTSNLSTLIRRSFFLGVHALESQPKKKSDMFIKFVYIIFSIFITIRTK